MIKGIDENGNPIQIPKRKVLDGLSGASSEKDGDILSYGAVKDLLEDTVKPLYKHFITLTFAQQPDPDAETYDFMFDMICTVYNHDENAITLDDFKSDEHNIVKGWIKFTDPAAFYPIYVIHSSEVVDMQIEYLTDTTTKYQNVRFSYGTPIYLDTVEEVDDV